MVRSTFTTVGQRTRSGGRSIFRRTNWRIFALKSSKEKLWSGSYRAKLYAQKIDSLVQSRDYLFFPNSMQEVPGGMIRSIYTDYYFFGMFIDHVGVHLPTARGITQYLYVLNFDSPSLSDYRAERLAWGWRISFGFADGDTAYHAGFEVSTATGETVLTLAAPDLVMRYVGWLWDKRIGDPKFRRLD